MLQLERLIQRPSHIDRAELVSLHVLSEQVLHLFGVDSYLAEKIEQYRIERDDPTGIILPFTCPNGNTGREFRFRRVELPRHDPYIHERFESRGIVVIASPSGDFTVGRTGGYTTRLRYSIRAKWTFDHQEVQLDVIGKAWNRLPIISRIGRALDLAERPQEEDLNPNRWGNMRIPEITSAQ